MPAGEVHLLRVAAVGRWFPAYTSNKTSRHLYMLAFQHIAWLSLAPKATLTADYRRSTQVLTWFNPLCGILGSRCYAAGWRGSWRAR